MGDVLLVSASGPVRRVALVEHGVPREVITEPRVGQRLVGSVYLGRVVRVLPGMQSAFVEIGLQRTAFLYAGDLNGGDPDAPLEPISQRLTEGQKLVVQVAKEPLGTKGARITANVTLPGRFLVYMPTVDHVGVSRRIEDEAERDRLRELATALAPEQGGLIVRTVGQSFEKGDFEDDLAFLCELWADIEVRAGKAEAPALLHADLELSLMATRDILTPEFDALIVDTREEYDRLAEFLERFMPRCRDRLVIDEKDTPLFARYGVEQALTRAMDRKVWLESGGYIVIDPTEALTAVDVNTGRYVGKTNFEDTVLQINLEAVEEIAYQLRLRNIGGIIVIDFIDMAESENRESVHDALIDALAGDRVRTRVLPMSQIGLIEMTRKRASVSLHQAIAQSCQVCNGRGWTLNAQEVSRQVVGKIRDTVASRRDLETVTVRAAQSVLDALLEDHGDEIESIRRRAGIEIVATRHEMADRERFEVKGKWTKKGDKR